ncbi:MAG: glycosyltransferase family protein [Zoogloeaceae bacterium]|jgi:GT2 family glycosyltransferase|nr:glycosyltransferase family protein [Zoogloeaceae bacterium]
MPPVFSVVICSINAWKFAQTSACYEHLLQNIPHEIIGIHDAVSLCSGYNRGLQRAHGDVVIFSHDDMLFLDPDFAEKIAARMRDYDLLGFAGTTRVNLPMWMGSGGFQHLRGASAHWIGGDTANQLQLAVYGSVEEWPVAKNIAMMDGLCLIARHETAAAVGFDEDAFDGWHLYDCDFSFSVFLAGFRTGVCCDIPFIHATASLNNGNSFGSEDYARYARRFWKKYREHMRPEKIKRMNCSMIAQDYRGLVRDWTQENFRKLFFTGKKRWLSLTNENQRYINPPASWNPDGRES